ncbi:unnamed protein product [Rotaria sp. Silwood1]|nr:unnamed protein product [Rotaria sp. Silwood1]CAF1610675.1 unnamed protein product [Rotaria sp. Silwood1]CAF4998778.1 unnamed protein product [Rotaria sp. Silwood1]
MLFIISWFASIKIIYHNDQCQYVDNSSLSYINNSLLPNVETIDSRLTLNHFTILGTHNSYHQRNLFFPYQHSNLEVQLTTGTRQIELDIHLMPNNDVVYHLQLFDDKTNCYCLSDCLRRIFMWSKQNPRHYPIFLFMEVKQMFYEDLLTGLTGGVKCQHLESIIKQILQLFSIDSFILPEQIQGNQSSISLALKKQRQHQLYANYTYEDYGWPPLYVSLGKILPIFTNDEPNIIEFISTCKPFSKFFFILQTNLDLPYASFISISNPLRDEQLMIQCANNGQITRVLLKYDGGQLIENYRQAKQYGVHIISTDSVQCSDTELCQSIANDFQSYSPILCNTVTAPSFCNRTVLVV